MRLERRVEGVLPERGAQADRADRTWGKYRRWELSPKVTETQARFLAMREKEVAEARARLAQAGR